jgi:phosphate transport system permease protein
MQTSTLTLILLLASVLAYHLGKQRALRLAEGVGGIRQLHSMPGFYGAWTALWAGVPALLLIGAWLAFEPYIIKVLLVASLPEDVRGLNASELGLLINDIKNLAEGNIVSGQVTQLQQAAADKYLYFRSISQLAMSVMGLLLGALALAYGWRKISPGLRARNRVETFVNVVLILCSSIAVLTTIGIVLSVLFEALRFFGRVPWNEFLFGLNWSPQTAIRADQVGSSGAFGAVPLFAGTLLISAIAMLVAVPIGLMSAIFLAEYASSRVRSWAKPVLELLAGIPTVVYGFFAALVMAPWLRDMGATLGLTVASESALAAGLVMGIMIIPFVSSLSDDVINAVPQSLRDGAYALGATRSETVRQVILPAALPGIVGSILLAVSRAIGETMIVVMAAGLAANLTANPLQAVTTVTVQIVTLLTGDQEFDSAKTLAAFALGLVLFLGTLGLNVIALYVVRKYREQYD